MDGVRVHRPPLALAKDLTSEVSLPEEVIQRAVALSQSAMSANVIASSLPWMI
jgi:hypothetical protein